MVQINFALKEVNCKVVFYGPGKSGKTTNLEMVHKNAPANARGDLTSIATEGDRTLFFDFMPLDLGTIAGMKTKFQLYTVPGQVYYNSTRKLVLQGCDGVIFVADSSRAKLAENIESLKNLEENLAEYGKKLSEVPFVLQWNKRDAADAMPPEELDKELNWYKVPTFEAVAFKGDGVFPTLKALSQLVLQSLNKDKRPGSTASAKPASPPPTAGGGAPPPPPP
ncbi:MAG: GTPase, partial [Planctomycetaceae bacterium]|nr:GTPase [Planctomycetaceae bacterium]